MATQIQSQDLEGGVVAPGNYKYYGTDGVGAEGFQDLDTAVSALGFSQGGVPAPAYANYLALENINVGQYVSKTPITFSQPLFGSTFFPSGNYFSGSPYTLNQGQALSIANNVNFRTISARWLNGESGTTGTTSYSIEAKIYAASGTPGSGAVPTGAALYTSTLVAGNIGADGDVDITFTFPQPAYLVAGNYCISFEGTASRASGTGDAFNPYGTGAIAGKNGYNLGVANNAVNFYYDITTFDYGVVLSDATDSTKLTFVGVATQNKVTDQIINIQTAGTYAEVGATLGEYFYMSDTPGDISSTPGTNSVLMGIGYDTNIVSFAYGDYSPSPFFVLATLVAPSNQVSTQATYTATWTPPRSGHLLVEIDYDNSGSGFNIFGTFSVGITQLGTSVAPVDLDASVTPPLQQAYSFGTGDSGTLSVYMYVGAGEPVTITWSSFTHTVGDPYNYSTVRIKGIPSL